MICSAFEAAKPTQNFFYHITQSDVIAIVEFETPDQFSVKDILFKDLTSGVPKFIDHKGKRIGMYTKRILNPESYTYRVAAPSLVMNIPYLVFLKEYTTYVVKPHQR